MPIQYILKRAFNDSRAKYAAPTMNAATRRPRRVGRGVDSAASAASRRPRRVGRGVGRDAVDSVPTFSQSVVQMFYKY